MLEAGGAKVLIQITAEITSRRGQTERNDVTCARLTGADGVEKNAGCNTRSTPGPQ